MKYVVITAKKEEKDGLQSVIKMPFIFPDHMVHAHVAKAMCLLLEIMHPGYIAEPTSAGELSSMSIERGALHGESNSLKLKSDPADNDLVQMLDYGSGTAGL